MTHAGDDVHAEERETRESVCAKERERKREGGGRECRVATFTKTIHVSQGAHSFRSTVSALITHIL